MGQGGKSSRQKGDRFELRVAKRIVSAFAGRGITSADCYRIGYRGRMRGSNNRSAEPDPGDLYISPALQELFPYTVECKSYRGLNWAALLTEEYTVTGHWAAWWTQVCSSLRADTEPLLVFKGNRTDMFAMFRATNDVWYSPHLRARVNDDEVVVLPLDRLLDGL